MSTISWKHDPAHSEIQFKVKHLMITTVTGYLKDYKVDVETEDEEFTKTGKILFTAEVNSIETNNAQRDTHLKSADFFDAENHGQIRFEGKNYQKSGDSGKLEGDLTIRGTTRPVSLNVEYGGTIIDPYGNTKAGFTITGKISRKEFGLLWNDVTEAGKIVVSDEIRINCELQLVKQ